MIYVFLSNEVNLLKRRIDSLIKESNINNIEDRSRVINTD